MSESPLHPLHSAPQQLLLNNPVRQHFYLAILSFIGLSATAGILYLIGRQAASPAGTPPLFLARTLLSLAVAIGMIAMISLAAVLVIGSQAAKTETALETLRSGHALVNWTYPPEVWKPWIKRQYGKSVSQAAMIFTVCVIAMPVVLVVLQMYAGSNRLNLSARQDNQIYVLIPLAVFVGVSGLYLAACISTRARFLRNPPFTCHISDAMVYMHGNVRAFTGPYGQLVGVKLVHGAPSTLGFRFETEAGRTNYRNTINVPVPPGQEAMAEKLVKHFEALLR